MNGSLNKVLQVIIQHTIDACNQWRYVNLNVQLFHKQSVLVWFQLISSVLMQITQRCRQSVHEHLHSYSRINHKNFRNRLRCPLCFILSLTPNSTDILNNYKTCLFVSFSRYSPSMGHGLLTHEVSRSHTTTQHSR